MPSTDHNECRLFFPRDHVKWPYSTVRVRKWSQGPFLERPDNLTGPESDFDIKVSRKVGRVLTSDEVHFVSLADNFTVQFSNLLKLPREWKTKQLNGSFKKRAPGARFSKDPVTTGPDNLPGRLTGNFTGPEIAFLEAPVNFPDTYRAR